MRLTTTQLNRLTIIQIDGELNVLTANDFLEQVGSMLDGGMVDLIFDCALLTYISSAGIRAIFMLMDRLDSTGGRILFCRIRNDVKGVFHSTNLDAECSVYATPEEAASSLESGRGL